MNGNSNVKKSFLIGNSESHVHIKHPLASKMGLHVLAVYVSGSGITVHLLCTKYIYYTCTLYTGSFKPYSLVSRGFFFSNPGDLVTVGRP